MSRRSRRSGPKRSYTGWIILGLVVVFAAVVYFIFTQSAVTGGSPLIGQPVSQTVLNELAGVSQQTFTFLGPGASGTFSASVASGSTSPLLTLNGKPEVLYMGGEYCPYCASERWPLIVALDKFGNFSGLQYMQSAGTPEPFPITDSFTFQHASYTSNYLSFVPLELQDRSHNPLMAATANQSSLQHLYDPSGNIPFVDIGNKYIVNRTQVSPAVLHSGANGAGPGYNWTQIGSQLDNASSPLAQNIDGAANRLIAAFCKVDGNQPASTCSNSALVLGYTKSSQPQASDLVFSPPPASGSSGRPSRLSRL